MDHLAVVACSGCGAGMPVRANESFAVCRFCNTRTPLDNPAVQVARQGGAAVESTLADGLAALRDALTRKFAPNAGFALAMGLASMGLGMTSVIPLIDGFVKSLDGMGGGLAFFGTLVVLPLMIAAVGTFFTIAQLFATHLPRRRADREIERLRAKFDLEPQPGNCPHCGGQCQIPGASVTFDCVYCHTPLLATAGMLVVWGEEAGKQAEGWSAEARRIVKGLEDRLRRMTVPYVVGGFASSMAVFGASAYWSVAVAMPGMQAFPALVRIGLAPLIEAVLIAFVVLAIRRGWLSVGIARAATFEDGLAAFARGDLGTALRIWRRKAERGDGMAQWKLGTMYYRGEGVVRDHVQAHVWLSLAARNESCKTSQELADAARQMTSAQLEEARKLAGEWSPAGLVNWRPQAEQGYPMAQYKLGMMYYKGRGALRDYVQALAWLFLAARDSRYRDLGRKALDGAVQQMTPEQTAEAQRLASEWKPGRAIGPS